MNWKKIRQEWEAGNKQIAVELLRSMIDETKRRQTTLKKFGEVVKCSQDNTIRK